MSINKDNVISLETYVTSNEDLKGFFLANNAFFAGGFENKIQRTRQEINNLTKEIMELNTEQGKLALKEGKIDKEAYKKNVTDISKKDFLVAALKGHFLGNLTLGIRGWKKGDQLKSLQKELQAKLKEYDAIVEKAISTEDHEETVSNPDTDDRVDNVEKVEVLIGEKNEEIEEIATQIDECIEVDAVLGKVEEIAQEALDTGKADAKVGEVTHIALTELFGKAGITNEVTLPSVESFRKDETAKYALAISIESIKEARTLIQSSMETAERLIGIKTSEIAIANEGLKDDVKDLLSRKTNSGHIAQINDFAKLVNEASKRSLNKDMKENSGLKYYFNVPTALNYLSKDNEIVSDISKGIFEDAENMIHLSGYLSAINSELTKESPDKDKVLRAANDVGELEFQGNAYISIGKDGKNKANKNILKIQTENISVRGLAVSFTLPSTVTAVSVLAFLGLPPTLAGMYGLGSLLGAYLTKKLTNPTVEKNIIKIEDALFKGNNNFKQVATKYSKAMELFAKEAEKFQSVIEDKVKSEDEVTRDLIRSGHSVINSVTKIIKLAEPFYKRVA